MKKHRDGTQENTFEEHGHIWSHLGVSPEKRVGVNQLFPILWRLMVQERERERGLNYVEQSEMSSKAEVNFNGTSNYFYV